MIELMPSRSRSSVSLATSPSMEPMNTLGEARYSSTSTSTPVRARIRSSRSAAALRGWSVTWGAVPVG